MSNRELFDAVKDVRNAWPDGMKFNEEQHHFYIVFSFCAVSGDQAELMLEASMVRTLCKKYTTSLYDTFGGGFGVDVTWYSNESGEMETRRFTGTTRVHALASACKETQ